MKQTNETQKLRKVVSKNQQRCLNSQPFSRQRAYLNKQKCQQKIMVIQDSPHFLNETEKLFDDQRDKFKTQQLKKLSKNSSAFDSAKILKQLNNINILINALEEKKSIGAQPQILSKSKTKTTHSTQIDSVPSPKSNASEYFIQDKLQRNHHKTEISKPQKMIRPKSEHKKIQTEHGQSYQRPQDKKMIKIKSNRSILKVYNPFPFSMTQML